MRAAFTDEQEKPSLARVLFTFTLLVTLVLIVADALSATFIVPAAGYTLLGTLTIGLLSWAGGPRIAQYLGPQLGGIAKGLASIPDRLRRTDSVRDDDERG